MRIISGSAGNRIIKVPKGLDVRPTPDLVRQAVFNSLGERVLDAHVLELFAGSGALSLECLSRGATDAVCIELSAKHAQFIRQNLATAQIEARRLDVRIQDAFTGIHQLAASGRKFDLIMADPPYGEKNVRRRSTSLAQKMLDDESLPSLLAEGGTLVLGHARRDTVELTPAWEERKFMRHGDTVMRFLRRAGPTGIPDPGDEVGAAPAT